VRSVEHREPIYTYACDRCGKQVLVEDDLKIVAIEADDDIGLVELAGKQMLLMDFCGECLDGLLISPELVE